MVCPSASDCSTGSLLSSVKCQPSVAPLFVSVADSDTGSIENVPICELAPKPGRSVLTDDDLNDHSAVWVSVRSTSWIANVPQVVSEAPSCSLTVPFAASASLVIVGASLAPLIVTVTSCAICAP